MTPILALIVLLMASPALAGEHVIAPDAWFQRKFDYNMRLCAVRSNQPEWCAAWIDAIESARPKTQDVTLPEWRRGSFGESLKVCTTLLPPAWCPDWLAAMRELSTQPAYRVPAEALSAARIRAEDERDAKIEAWRAAIAHVGENKVTPNDLALIQQHVKDRDVVAMEMLGWMYATGRGLKLDYVRAYEAYGRAVLAGREDLRPTLDALWKRFNETERNELHAIFKAPAPPPAPRRSPPGPGRRNARSRGGRNGRAPNGTRCHDFCGRRPGAPTARGS